MNKGEYIIVFVTTSGVEESKKIASTLIEKNLGACVNIIPEVSSVYKWEGEICKDTESMMIIKTSESKFEKLKNRIKKMHSYDVPEIISFDIKRGDKEYFDWIDDSLKI